MRTLAFLFILLTSMTAAAADAVAYKFGWADFSVNRLDWNEGTKLKSEKQDFYYLEFEGAAQFDWGDLYGFFDIENPGKPADETHTAAKGQVRYYLFDTPFSLYGQVYNFAVQGFSEQNDVVGLGYQLVLGGFQFKPFLGFHEIQSTIVSGFNGYMGGWFVSYTFHLIGESFMLADWHEIEFARNALAAQGNGGSTVGHNGAASIWWTPTPRLTPGFQWRYAIDKLGTPGKLDAQIFSLKYNF